MVSGCFGCRYHIIEYLKPKVKSFLIEYLDFLASGQRRNSSESSKP